MAAAVLFGLQVADHQIKFPCQAKAGHLSLTIVGNGDDLWRMAMTCGVWRSIIDIASCIRRFVPDWKFVKFLKSNIRTATCGVA